jgi:hypothetical protein
VQGMPLFARLRDVTSPPPPRPAALPPPPSPPPPRSRPLAQGGFRAPPMPPDFPLAQGLARPPPAIRFVGRHKDWEFLTDGVKAITLKVCCRALQASAYLHAAAALAVSPRWYSGRTASSFRLAECLCGI